MKSLKWYDRVIFVILVTFLSLLIFTNTNVWIYVGIFSILFQIGVVVMIKFKNKKKDNIKNDDIL